jgi:GntR family transcriptional repressor for pyruvate dehydrogenase complex
MNPPLRELLREVQVRSASDAVIDQLLDLLSRGALRPGERLPAEIELARALGVGRSTVREAKKVLIARGFLEARGKLGTFVAALTKGQPDQDALAAYLSDSTAKDLHECREIVEVSAARLAAQRAGQAELDALRAALDRLDQAVREGSGEAGFRAVDFHRSVVVASQNAVLVRVFDLLGSVVRSHQMPFYRALADQRREVERHRELLEIIARGEPDLAAAAMADHLSGSEQVRRDALREIGRE